MSPFWLGTEAPLPDNNMQCTHCGRRWQADKPKRGLRCVYCDSKKTVVLDQTGEVTSKERK
jgi:hypothetical protein